MKTKKVLWVDYYEKWIELNKEGAVRPRTLEKYYLSLKHLREFYPDKALNGLTRDDVQKFLNWFGKTHEKATVQDLYRQIGACLKDAHYEGYMRKDPTYRLVIKGKKPAPKKKKYLEVDEASDLIKVMRLKSKETGSPLGFMCEFALRTGLRYAELLGLTPADIDYRKHAINVTKTFNYKLGSSKKMFVPTKNRSSVRTVTLDKEAEMIISYFAGDCETDKPIWVEAWQKYLYSGRCTGPGYTKTPRYTVFNSTVNKFLKDCCEQAKVPVIAVHGLRHTHASILIANGVSIQSVANRLGHTDTTTTQEVYIHLLNKLKSKDEEKIESALEGLV